MRKLIVCVLLLSLLTLPGCTFSYSSGSGTDYKFAIYADTQRGNPNEYVNISYDTLNSKDLKNGAYLWPRSPRGTKSLGIYLGDTLVADENGFIVNANAIKKYIGKHIKKPKKQSIPLTMKTELLHFDLELDLNGGSLSYGEDDTDPVRFENVTIFDLAEDPHKYFPLAWKENSHFAGWQTKEKWYNPLEDMYFNVYQDMIAWGLDDFEPFDYSDYGNTTWMARYFSALDDAKPVSVTAIYHDKDDTFRVYSRYLNEAGTWETGAKWFGRKGGFTDYLNYVPPAARQYPHSFFRWSTSKTEYIPFDGTLTGDREIYYYELRCKSFSLNPLNGDAVKSVTVTELDEIEYPDGWELSVPAGYTFGGWYLSRECEGDPVLTDNSFTFNDEIPDGATLYAKWIKAA